MVNNIAKRSKAQMDITLEASGEVLDIWPKWDMMKNMELDLKKSDTNQCRG